MRFFLVILLSVFFLSCLEQENNALTNQLISFNTEEDVMAYSQTQEQEFTLRLSLFKHKDLQYAIIRKTHFNGDSSTTIAQWKVIGTNLLINPLFISTAADQNYHFDTEEAWELFLSDLEYSTMEREMLVNWEKVLREVPELSGANSEGKPVLLLGSELISAFKLEESIDLTYLMAAQEGSDIK